MKNFSIYKIIIFHRYLYVTRTQNAKKHNNRNMLDKKNICHILYFKATLKKANNIFLLLIDFFYVAYLQ